MSEIIPTTETSHAIVIAPPPQARCAVSVRPATVDDLPFIDALQKMHGHMVGFATRGQLQQNIEDGHVVIAEEQAQSAGGGAVQIGYCIFKYEYMKRDEVGIVYQLNVMPIRHRHLVGATLIKAVFDGAPYGCRLFCCWCAQDIQANWFWESIGFVPLAFRTGSRAKQRIHIFWQRRVRGGDDSTPYWFPAKTENGAVGEDRIVLPIPPGTHWRDAKPTILPGLPAVAEPVPQLLPGGQPVRIRPEKPQLTRSQRAALERAKSAHLGAAPLGKKAVIRGGRIKYVAIPGFDPSTDGPDELACLQKPKKPRAPKQKHDPKYLAAARDLRDMYLEQVNTERMLPGATGKYDVSRQLAAAPTRVEPVALLKAAA
jgi:hypothetical protein